jgi:toxin ParE1/3/4
MGYEIGVKPGAEEDIEIAFNWYEDQKEGLGKEFLAELMVYYKKLENTPSAFGKLKRNYSR